MIKEKLERYARILDSIRGDQDKYVWLMDFGKNSVPMEAKHKMEEFEVSNCQTATWLVPHYVEIKFILVLTQWHLYLKAWSVS